MNNLAAPVEKLSEEFRIRGGGNCAAGAFPSHDDSMLLKLFERPENIHPCGAELFGKNGFGREEIAGR